MTTAFKDKVIWISVILILLPFSIQFCTYAIIGFAALAIITLIKQHRPITFYKNPSFWIPSSLPWLALLGLLYTFDMKAGRQAIEVQATLWVFPFIFSELGISKLEFRKIKFFFIAMLFTLCLVLEFRIVIKMIISGYSFFQYFFSYDYTYKSLTTEYVVQPVYFGIYLVLSNIFCLTFLLDKSSTARRSIILIIILFNSFFLLQLGVRSGVVLNIALVIPYSLYILFKIGYLKIGVPIIGTILLGLCIFFFFSSGFTKNRMFDTIYEFTSSDLRKFDPKSRMIIWPSALKVIQDNLICGVGTGDDESYLFDVYKKGGFDELYQSGLNAHNQYLTIVMRHGLLGIAVILLSIFYPFYIYWKRRELESFLFIVLISGFFITENVLSRAQGVIFFSLFQSIYLAITFGNGKNENTRLWN